MKQSIWIALLMVIAIGLSAALYNAEANEPVLEETNSIEILDPCADVTGRFQVKGDLDLTDLSSATKSLSDYGKLVVVESLMLTKQFVSKAFDLAIESI